MRFIFNVIIIVAVLGVLTGAGTWVFASAEQSGRETMSVEAAAARSAMPGQFVTVDGLKTHFTVTGSGETMVLLHGFMGSGYSWRAMIPALETRFRIFALDLPGFGFTERSPDEHVYTREGQAAFVRDFLAQQGVERAVVVGYAMGGGTAMALAQRYPKLVDRLVLVTPDPQESHLHHLQNFLGTAYSPLVRTAAVLKLFRHSKLEESLRAAFVDPERVSGTMVDEYYLPLRVKGTGNALVTFVKAAASRKGLPDPERVSTSTLIIWGEDDGVLSPEVGRRLAQQMPHASLSLVAATGHRPQEEEPAVVGELILKFLSAQR